MLMNSAQGVNFTNISRRLPFSHKSILCSFLLITVWFSNFFGKIILAHKLLLKLGEIDYKNAKK